MVEIREFEQLMLNMLVPGLVIFMAFIVWDISRKHDAGRFGTLILFGTLGFGVLGFGIKKVIAINLGI
ncbi:DUF2788 domain-containing protein [Sansalvadorimonas sp. 2012CJ34-2]|uniref:DUF2788 domain-containing protein n=1 Tax=Parendozoicomonas callyspongiae TaxID=2942213 RepID=A0ABT0PJS4_9GAMM|nr:DUF2788 domain-containing protein [Sansalvadorimonas sp. 2012CJ34-2]MCL6271620.1 DUF2788 domain-containing protein [Sansalvadorimonas sp. 2012CJ34-2]